MNRSRITACLLSALALLTIISPVQAQRSIGPRGYLRVVLKDAVQKDLGINENAELKTKLEEMIPEFKKEAEAAFQKERELRNNGGQGEGMRAVDQKYNEKVAALLTAEQVVRIKQFLWQEMSWRRFSDVEFAQKLELNQEQNASIQVAEKQWTDDYRGRLEQLKLRNISPKEFRDQMQQSTAEITEKINGFLTEEQRKQLPTLLGKPFDTEELAK